MNQEILFCIIVVVDLYAMIPQIEEVLLFKMLDYFKLKQIGGLKQKQVSD